MEGQLIGLVDIKDSYIFLEENFQVEQVSKKQYLYQPRILEIATAAATEASFVN